MTDAERDAAITAHGLVLAELVARLAAVSGVPDAFIASVFHRSLALASAFEAVGNTVPQIAGARVRAELEKLLDLSSRAMKG